MKKKKKERNKIERKRKIRREQNLYHRDGILNKKIKKLRMRNLIKENL